MQIRSNIELNETFQLLSAVNGIVALTDSILMVIISVSFECLQRNRDRITHIDNISYCTKVLSHKYLCIFKQE